MASDLQDKATGQDEEQKEPKAFASQAGPIVVFISFRITELAFARAFLDSRAVGKRQFF
jgi:hypothetical protein